MSKTCSFEREKEGALSKWKDLIRKLFLQWLQFIQGKLAHNTSQLFTCTRDSVRFSLIASSSLNEKEKS